ncbi:hypothetical protein CPB97_011422 [Podila verticillata]|nr:hypothetical protein CPB97_011422 [Podila verticillata]
MKAAPNTLLFLSPLEEVKTFGILVEGYHVTLYEMFLPSEAMYIMKWIGQFMVPRNNEDFLSVGRMHAIVVVLLAWLQRFNIGQEGHHVLKCN